MINNGTFIQTRAHDQRVVGETFQFFQGLISVKLRNFHTDKQTRLARSFKISPVAGNIFVENFCPGAGLLTTSKEFPGLPGGGC